MKRISTIISILLLLVTSAFAQNSSVFTRAGISGIQVGYNFEPITRVNLPISIGISSNFIEKKYNDFSVEVWPNYQLQRKK